MLSIVKVCFTFIVITSYSFCATILCYFPFPSFSHQSVFQPIWKELSLRGHELVVITPNPLNESSLKTLEEIDVSASYEYIKNNPLQNVMSQEMTRTERLVSLYEFSLTLLEHQLNQQALKKFLLSDVRKFDLIILEGFWHPLYALSWKYDAPIVGVSSFPLPLQIHFSMGNPIHPICYPDINDYYDGSTGFLRRWNSVAYTVWQYYNYYFTFLPHSQQIARKYFGSEVPDLHELSKNISLHLAFVNPIINSPRPNVPAVIEFANIHTRCDNCSLPKDLKKILDEATEGLIYFSLGSNVKSTSIPDNLKRVIMDALSELPYKVLWKWEASDMPGKSENVYLRKWLPQQALLAHPNLKVFVTQGGLQSIEESLINGVPMVGMPFYGDQHMNVIKLAEAGIAVYVDKDTVTRDELKNAILKVAADKRYKEKAVEAGNILSDHPMKPLDLAIWWIEYVIRHKGAPHLRSPAVDLPWYQYYLLDVLGASLMAVILAGYVLYKMITVMSRLIFASKKIKKS